LFIHNIYSANDAYFNPHKGGGFFNISDSVRYSEGYSFGENIALKHYACAIEILRAESIAYKWKFK
jgi:hypothetical protein